MLTSLTVRNLALIEHQQIEFSRGLNIVTGETGAGKSVIIGAAMLLLGQRADKSLIRHGSDACEIDGIFDLPAESTLLSDINDVLTNAGIPQCDGGQLLIRRWFSEKSARVHVNSTPATLTVLKDLGDLLVDVHGPYDHQSLLRPARQLAALDAFSGCEKDLAACLQSFQTWQKILTKKKEAENERPSPELVDLLRFQIKEIEKANLKPGDDEEELNTTHAKMANASQILEIVARSRDIISDGESSVLDHLASVARDIQELSRIDPDGARHLSDLVNSAHGELQNLADELSDYGDDVDVDPREFDRLEARLSLVQRLKRKYGSTIEEIIAHADDATRRLSRLEDLDAVKDDLARQADEAEKTLRKHCATLAKRRRKHASKLATAITHKLKRLGFEQAEFDIKLEPANPGPHGADSCEFLVAPNPGEGISPLRSIASSGEIARIMLALKTVLAAADHVPLLIFDEVDANVGGEVAVIVGEELRDLASEHQLICISHLPQIAAVGDRHFRVAKDVRNDRTVAHMDQLDMDQRIDEIARMLGGKASSSVVRTHAQELISHRRQPDTDSGETA